MKIGQGDEMHFILHYCILGTNVYKRQTLSLYMFIRLQLIVKSLHRLNFSWSCRSVIFLVSFIGDQTDSDSSRFSIPVVSEGSSTSMISPGHSW